MQSYRVGVDIGGTFTDCVVVDGAGRVTIAKAPSTPENFAAGMLEALGGAAGQLGMTLSELCRQTAVLSHGTTVGTNALVQKRGVKVGLITTKGHNDVLHIMRGSRGLIARDMRKIVHFPESQKPDPIIPKRLIEGVSERIDCFGKVIVELNEAEAEAAIRRLLAKGIEAIAVCFLWSFKRPEHERRVKAMIEQIAPKMFVSCSSELVPKWGEYERTTAVALNAYIGPLMVGYLANLDNRLKELGYAQPLQITQCGGGTISVDKAMEAPLLTLDSGPVSGVAGSLFLGKLMGCRNIITTDMGGTSFDVGIVFEDQLAFSFASHVNQYEYFIPRVDLEAIGAGGGSMVRLDETTRSMRVGPESAGAVPGPMCYDKGGEVPTVTDADVVLGYINPDNFAGGSIKLDKRRAERAIQDIADRLGFGLLECASGIAKIVEFQMADIIRKTTIEKGFDPRDFVLFAFGGAGPAHAGVFARELGVQKVIVPQGDTASCWCAFGAATADILHIYEQVDIMASPFSVALMNQNLARLAEAGRRQLERDAVAAERQQLAFALDIRHKGQINEVEIALPADEIGEGYLRTLAERFYERYERLYGQGSSFRGTPLEIVTFRVRATAQTPPPRLQKTSAFTETISARAKCAPRAIYWADLQRQEETPIFDGAHLRPGNRIVGPAVIETSATTVVVHPGRTLAVDGFGNFEITFGSVGSP